MEDQEEKDDLKDLKDFIQSWFERFMSRFDKLDKFIELMTSQHHMINGERHYDNQYLCQLLNVSKRTLQRYRSNGDIPYQTIYHKTYYKESDVIRFIREHFNKDKDNNTTEDN